MSNKRIFVSATSRALESYRRLAAESLRKRGYEVDDQAIFNLTFLEIQQKLKQRIERCDAVVCLIGFAYGAEPSNRPPDQPRRSYTQWEYFLARELNRPVYLLLADKATRFDPDPERREPESDELRSSSADTATRLPAIATGQHLPARATSAPSWPSCASPGSRRGRSTSPTIYPCPRSARSSRAESLSSTTCAPGSACPTARQPPL
jgi:hypothetical protein